MAGEIVIQGDYTMPPGTQGALRLMWGTVVLDGSNQTPVALTNYMANVTESPMFAIVTMAGTAAPADDPNYVTQDVSGVTINVYAWKNTSGTDPTYTASTDNARVINWFAVGPHI
jgi:hypothetical protein